jgi:hypothetical protein
MIRPAGSFEKLLIACAAGAVFAYAASLAVMFAAHHWLLDAQGRPLVMDFLAVWSAGGLARGGTAPAAYDAHLQHAAEVAAVGHDFKGGLGWPYPPFFLLMAAGLACLGYAWAFVVWTGATIAGYAVTVGAIAKSRTAVLLALAAPWALATLFVGQNGFLTAALIGLVLLNLKRLPALSGILLGLMTYKPQFGLLFPLALAMGGHWRAFVMASLTALFLIALSNAVYGSATFAAFLHVLPQTAQTLLDEGAVGWSKLQSVYGLARWLGLSSAAGWAVQAAATFACATAVIRLWRSGAAYELKAAGLAVAALLATPYLFVYDLPILAVAIAFLYRDRAFDRIEIAALGLALLCVAAFAVLPAPTGLLAILAIAAIILRRVLSDTSLSQRANLPQAV